MGQTNRRSPAWPSLAVLLAVSLSALQPAIADDTPEREQLAVLARYHFDYARLRADMKRVRAGLQDYLAPQRAQPRDPVPLAGDYVRRDRADDEEPSP